MVKTNGLILEYEEILTGRRREPSSGYKGKNLNTEYLIDLFRYVYEDLFEWTPDEIVRNTDADFLEKLGLTALFSMLPFPPELDPKVDFYYIGHILYPDIMPYDKKAMTLRVYEKVLSREIMKFPKRFFDGGAGRISLQICLQAAISSNLNFSSIEELYRYFASARAMKFLQDMKILVPCLEAYGSPLNLLHDTLSEGNRSELYYRFYLFADSFVKQKNILKKKLKARVQKGVKQ